MLLLPWGKCNSSLSSPKTSKMIVLTLVIASVPWGHTSQSWKWTHGAIQWLFGRMTRARTWSLAAVGGKLWKPKNDVSVWKKHVAHLLRPTWNDGLNDRPNDVTSLIVVESNSTMNYIWSATMYQSNFIVVFSVFLLLSNAEGTFNVNTTCSVYVLWAVSGCLESFSLLYLYW